MPGRFSLPLLRLSLCAIVVSAAAGAIAIAGAADTPVFSSTVFFRITYRSDCTLTVSIDGGPSMDSTVPSSATIPPGPYQVSVRTPLPDATWDPSVCSVGRFSFTGPGVSFGATLGTDLGPYSATFNPTLAAASTYTIADASHPTAPIVFQTAASGSSSSLIPAPPASTAKGTGTQQELMGSGIVPYRGALIATVPTTGQPSLDTHGKPLATVKAGRYDIVVKDASPHGGFFVQKAHKQPVAIAGVAFTGKRTVRVNLTVGKWSYYAKSGKPIAFVVTV
ncbi:MAG TPA: hypothetical protein VGM80_02115 [Gaiellaceae bacterium]|jgi:hypothetical protein